MARLKGAIISLRDVIVRRGSVDQALTEELGRLISLLRNLGVQPVFVGNRAWQLVDTNGKRTDLREALNARWGELPWYIAANGDMPWKPLAASMQHVLAQQGWIAHQAIYLGNTEEDMKTAANGNLLFLNAKWHGEGNPYGYSFNSPKDVARFVDCFCTRVNDWFWSIEDGSCRVYAAGPFSTRSAQYAAAAEYSSSARQTAKHFGGDATFWGRLLAASVYLSGLGDEIDYITSYPGHSTRSALAVVSDALTILAGSIRKRYLPNLIIRHTSAPKSQATRIQGNSVSPLDQLNTIHLNAHPKKNRKGDVYANPPLKRGKMVLVVDDFCTEGNAFETARAYIQSTGASAICLAWLKTINTDYYVFQNCPRLNPYTPNRLTTPIARTPCSYTAHIRDKAATNALADVFSRYYAWEWPADI